MPSPLAYLNDRFVPASQAVLPVYDAGIVMGATVSELTRTFHHKTYRLADHLRRLSRSLRYARLDPPLDEARFAEVSEQVVAHNAALVDERTELGLVHFVTAGAYATYAAMADEPPPEGPTLCIHTFPLRFEMWAEKIRSGAHLVIPSIRQVPPQSVAPQIKCRSRMHYYLADREARLVDPHATALLLDHDGNVAETNGANLLIVEGGGLVSPTLRNTLGGISRDTVIDLASRLGIPFTERDIQPHDVINADEALLASTPYCILPATRINHLPIGDGRPGPIFHRLIAAWSRDVGLDIAAQITAASRPTGN